jgi:heat-inducible transcriptional repressor
MPTTMMPPLDRAAGATLDYSVDERGEQVLRALVSAYLDTGEPVGSRTLSRALRFGWSAATIRNTMADLESLGYLAQPHASAGRMPTDLGYRYFVDRLLEPEPLSSEAAGEIAAVLVQADDGIEVLLGAASRLLADRTGNLGLVLAPSLSRLILHHLELLRLTPRHYLLVLVSGSGLVQKKVFTLDEDLAQDQLDAVGRYLCDQFRGLTLPEIRRRLLAAIAEDQRSHDRLVAAALKVGRQSLVEEPAAPVFVEGAPSLVTQPEFADPALAAELLRALEQKARLVRILDACMATGIVQVRIGAENDLPPLERCSVVAASYCAGDRALGSIAVLGPTRMHYSQIITLVRALALGMSGALEQRYNQDGHESA